MLYLCKVLESISKEMISEHFGKETVPTASMDSLRVSSVELVS